jgi:hypothetical protein
VGYPDLTFSQLARQVGVIASSSCSAMIVHSGDHLQRRHEGFLAAKDISAMTCSLPPSDLIARSTYSLCRWRAKNFIVPAQPPISTTSLTSDVSSPASCTVTHNPMETHDCCSPSCSVRTRWTRTAGGLRRPTPVCALTKTIYQDRIGAT